MNTTQPDPDLTRDEHLRAALRHAPDASLHAPAKVSQQIRAAALRAAVATTTAPARAEPSAAVAAATHPSRLTLWWRLWTGSGRAGRVGTWSAFATAATLATVATATLLAWVWHDTAPPAQDDRRVAMAVPQPDLAAQRSAPMPTAERVPAPSAPAPAPARSPTMATADQLAITAVISGPSGIPPPAALPRPAAGQNVPAAPSAASPRTAMAGAAAPPFSTPGTNVAGARAGLNDVAATAARTAPNAEAALTASTASATPTVPTAPTAPTSTSAISATPADTAPRAPTAVIAAAAPPAPTAAALADSASLASSTRMRSMRPEGQPASAPVPRGVSSPDFAEWLDSAAAGPDAPTLLTELAAATRGRWLPVAAPPAGAPAVVLPTRGPTPTAATLTLQADAAWGCLAAPAPRCQRAPLTPEQASRLRELMARRN